MPSDLLQRKRTHFLLWRPRVTNPPPTLVIGTLRNGNPPAFVSHRRIDFAPSAAANDLWEVAAAACSLADGTVYHYWFEVTNANPKKPEPARIQCTDPTAWAVDWRLRAPALPPPFGEEDRDPAGVVMWRAGALVPCDPGGEEPDWQGDTALDTLPANNRLVLYELPTTWAGFEGEGTVRLAVGTFRDVLGLVDPAAACRGRAGAPASLGGQRARAPAGRRQLR